MASYPHLIMRELGRASREFRPNFGGTNPPQPRDIKDRPEHAAKLRGDLAEISSALASLAPEQQTNGTKLRDVALPVTLIGVPEETLRIGGARLTSPTLPILGINRQRPGKPDRANMLVTVSGLKTLERALDKYEHWEGGKRPQRFNLFETLSTIRLSEVGDLWADDPAALPDAGEVSEWEVWIRRSAETAFRALLGTMELKQVGATDYFVDAAVLNVVADAGDILVLMRESGAVIELRPASTFEAEYSDYDPEERLERVNNVAARITGASERAPTTVLIDTGANYRHPMIGVALDGSDCHSIEMGWPTDDHAGHGSQMSGIALYGDVEAVVTGAHRVTLTTQLESVVVTAPRGQQAVPARDAIDRAVSIVEAENPDLKRVFCLAATAPGDQPDGRPTGASIMVDQLAWNNGRTTRMFCVAAGNVPAGSDATFPTGPYDERNKEFPIQAPGQAMNALTVGAVTNVSAGFPALAPAGDLCPSARTSQSWDVRYANKPDIVMEGGNQEVDRGGLLSRRTPRSMLLTTGKNHPRQPFQFTGETSAATAQAAGLTTRLLAAYPTLRPETLRALMVNSARWTPAMMNRLAHLKRIGLTEADAYGILLDCYGWGVPDEERLFRSASDALTLVIEDDLRPYVERTSASGGKRVCLREMKYFNLPWPTAALRALNQTAVEMRCTLSYFVEPDPGGAARGRPDRYGSHRLRFAVKTPNSTPLEAMQRINQLASEEDLDEPDVGTSIPGLGDRDAGWTVGRRRNFGSIHQDVWKGSGAELAQRGGLSVYPVRGWWADGRDSTFWAKKVRFSLVVSIDTPESDVDLMVEARQIAESRNLVPVRVVARRRRST